MTSLLFWCASSLSLTFCNPNGLQPARLPVHGDYPGKNTGVGCHALLQGIFPAQGLNPGLPHCRQILYWLGHQGSPFRYRKRKPIAWLCFAALSPTVHKAQEPVRWSRLLSVWSLLFLSVSKRWWIWIIGEDYLQGKTEKKKVFTVIVDVPSCPWS